MMTMSVFSKLVPFSRVNAQVIFNSFTRGAKELNGFEFAVGLIIISYSNYRNKLKLLFRIFDMDQTGTLSVDEAL